MSSMVMRFLASMTKMRFSRSLHSGDSCSQQGQAPGRQAKSVRQVSDERKVAGGSKVRPSGCVHSGDSCGLERGQPKS